MGDQLLHRLVILAILRPPDKARAIARPRYEPLRILVNCNCADRYFIYVRVKFPRVVLVEVPDAHAPTLVAENDITLVRVQDG